MCVHSHICRIKRLLANKSSLRFFLSYFHLDEASNLHEIVFFYARDGSLVRFQSHFELIWFRSQTNINDHQRRRLTTTTNENVLKN